MATIRSLLTIKNLRHNPFQPSFSPFPIGHAAGQKTVKGWGVIVDSEVAKFVHDDVVDAVHWGFDEFGVEQDIPKPWYNKLVNMNTPPSKVFDIL